MVKLNNISNTNLAKPSFSRWLRHACYLPWLTAYYFDKSAQDAIERAVIQAEQGHYGEIRVVIEGNVPVLHAYWHDTQQRAIQLFSQLRVWDTAYNSGILLYVNICARRVELLADRGIHQFVDAAHWQTICDHVSAQLQAKEYLPAVLAGIQQIGQTLQAFHQLQTQEVGDEILNQPVLL